MARRTPLADRMRPKELKDIIGQSHILAPGALLHRMIQAIDNRGNTMTKKSKNNKRTNNGKQACVPGKPVEVTTIPLPLGKAKEILNDLKPNANIQYLKEKYETPLEFTGTFRNGFTMHIFVSFDDTVANKNPIVLMAELHDGRRRLDATEKRAGLYKNWKIEHGGTAYLARMQLARNQD